ncbi:MAG TPA: hypothetical protein VFC21_03085, partial [Bryobacteraceae bacterium]|nr:hypothetical protein [Bryobacteraceae bacterium]
TNFCQPADKNGSLRRAIEGLSGLPGRKAVVLFSHVFGVSPANVALANRAGVTIYVLDPAGGHPGKVRVPGPVGVKGTTMLAEETGGFRKLTAPGHIGEDLREVLDEMSGYYLLGYHPAQGDFQAHSETGSHVPPHSIRLRVLREDLIVHARTTPPTYDESALKQAPQTREQYLQQALFSPFTSGGLRVSLQPAYTQSAPDRTFGIRFSMRLEVKQPGDYQIRVAVRDPASGKSGSAYTFLKIPDFSKGRLALATPVLGQSGWNEFAAGEAVRFSCEIVGSSAGKTEGEILLYYEDGPMGSPQFLSHKSDHGANYLEGAIPVPVDLPPGEYAIRMTTWDSGGGPSKPTGNSWTTLKILKLPDGPAR